MRYLLLPAETSSEWDGVSFALVPLSLTLQSTIKEKIKRQLELKSEGIDGIWVSCDNADFYNDVTQLPNELIKVDGNVKSGVVEFEDSFVKALTQPEQSIRYGRMNFSYGGVSFIAYGKHTDEEFSTGSIGLNDEGNFDMA
jgi:hypothetical protein